jgi:hypothetical protein
MPERAMNTYRRLREEARQLRANKHWALGEIATTLGVPKSTAYSWVRDIEIPKTVTERQKLNQHNGTLANQLRCAAIRQAAYDTAYSQARELLSDQRIRDFVVLYLAEGYRKDRNAVAIGNSNPTMILFAHSCMRRLASNSHFYYSFQYHSDQDPEALREYWAGLLGIDARNIAPVPKTNSGHLAGRRFACEYGIFQIRVGDTRFRAQLQALMDAVQEEWAAQ